MGLLKADTMRIDYLSASEIPSKFANSVHVMKMCSAFSSLGHHVCLYARKGRMGGPSDVHKDYNVGADFPIRFFNWPKLRVIGPLLYIWRVWFELLKAPRPDLYYSRYAYLLLPASFLGVDCIYEAHMFSSNPIARLAEFLLFRRKTFKHLVVISAGLKNDYRNAYPDAQSLRIITAHDGADLPVTMEKESGTTGHDRRGGVQIGYVGHLYPGRGMGIIEQLASMFSYLTFHIIGGKDEDVAFWKNQSAFPNVIFHGFVNHASIDRYYRLFDIALLPYQSRVTLEGGKGDTVRWMSPLKLFEYMAYQKAIIASDLPVLREVLTHGVTAVMVPPEDIDAWADALSALEGNCSLIKRLGREAQRLLVKEYSWRKRAERVLA